jgi:membrane protease YdiL (CAAX protease family)
VKRAAPFHLILTTMACLVLVNLVAAQFVLRMFYPSSSWQFGLPSLIAFAVLALLVLLATIRGWRAYLRTLRQDRTT